jgi:putative DNA primase/helicase
MKEAVFEGNHILEFLASEGYIRLKADLTVTTKDLYAVYCLWCEDNAIKPYAQNTMSHYLKEYGDAYNIVDTNNLQNERGVRVRGFEGIGIVIRPDAPHAKIYDVE